MLRFASVALSVVAVVGVITTALVARPTDGRSPSLVTESPSPQTAREGEVVEEMTEKEKAEAFAFRALAATGLTRPVAERTYLWTYADDTTQTNDGWSVGFVASTCTLSTCQALEDEGAATADADTFVFVTLRDEDWHVVDVQGNILEDERERVVGFSLPERDEPSHWEFPAVSVRSPDEGFSVTMFPLWVGHYPTSAPGSVCRIEPLNENGDRAGPPTVFYQEPPGREFERAGGVHGRGVPGADGAETVDVECRQYTGLGWEVASDPEIVGSPDEVSGITAELVWRGDEGFTTAAVCRATLVDEAGEVVWEGSSRIEPLWRPGELKDYPYRTDGFVSTRGELLDAEGIDEFSCRSL
ncbi:MAG: hypothetical protein M3391_10405 [Actinomycetota bacterium]|nr:hypothetical protein [Actinomycetota bacterium]